MKFTFPQLRPALRPRSLWAGAMVCAAFLYGSTALAAAPTAGTAITNSATASYVDADSKLQTAASNSVSTTVQMVGSFTFDGKATGATNTGNTVTGASSATVYSSHVLSNTGNGTDTFTITVTPSGAAKFTTIAIYADNDRNGLPDTSNALATANAGATLSKTFDLTAQSDLSFIVAYTLPSGTPTLSPFDTATVTAVPALASTKYQASNQSIGLVDSVNTTAAAAFTAALSFTAPGSGVTPPTGGPSTWPTAATSGKASTSTSCATTWASIGSSYAAGCNYAVLTLTYNNVGGSTGAFATQIGVPTGMTYVTGSAVASGTSGVALLDDNANTGTTGTDFKVSADGKTITFVDKAIPTNNTRTITFVALVNSTAAIGTVSQTATFSPSDVTTATDVDSTLTSLVTGTTAAAQYEVKANYVVALGTGTATGSDAADATAGTPGTGAKDTTTTASAAAGATLSFTHKVFNLGNGPDTYTLTFPAFSFPGTSAANAKIYAADGVTVLASSGTGGYTTGVIPAGGSATVIVKVTVPSTTAANAAANYSLTLLATSQGDATVKDASADGLTAVTGPFVDLTSTQTGTATAGDIGAGPVGSTPVGSVTVTSGNWVTLDLWIKNNDTKTNTYNLSYSTTNAFPGTQLSNWTVKFVAGPVASTGCAAATSASTTVNVTTGTSQQMTACVQVPANQNTIDQLVYIQAKGNLTTDGDGSIPSDTLLYQVSVKTPALTYTATLTPTGGGAATTTPSNFAVYTHAINNTGTGACLAPTVTFTSSNPAWTVVGYLDATTGTVGQLDASDTVLTSGSALPTGIAVNGVQNFFIKVTPGAGAAAGDKVTVDITVNFPQSTAQASDSCGSLTASDVTTVVSGVIAVQTSQFVNTGCLASTIPAAGSPSYTTSAGSAKPGDCVVYQIVATNTGSAAVSKLALSGGVPANTTLTPNNQQLTTQCSVNSSVTFPSGEVMPQLATTSGTAAGSTVTCSSSGSTTGNVINPGGAMTLIYQVMLNTQ